MKQLLILSGKGGTGKTTLASFFIRRSGVLVYGDCDVDAPNLHLILQQETSPKEFPYYGQSRAIIDQEACTQCGLCFSLCRFGAIVRKTEYQVDPFSCEGCGVCEALCPGHAISLHKAHTGDVKVYEDAAVFSTAELKMGSGNSGRLVTEVKSKMKEKTRDTPFAVIDGSPGIGCPVLASMVGCDLVLIVVEPSLAGFWDMKRIVETARASLVQRAVCINKWDTNTAWSLRIRTFCKEEGIAFVGQIPFSLALMRAINEGKSVDTPEVFDAFSTVYEETLALLLSV